MEQHSNIFDELGATNKALTERQQQEIAAKHEKLDHLIHATFAQNEKGEELLQLWKESLILNPTARGGMDMVSIGINEGKAEFIRYILLTIKRVETNE